MENHNTTSTSATIRTSASAMGYMCRFFCTCVRDTDVMNPSNQEQTPTPPAQPPEPPQPL
jgi:hypothetical protein